MEQLSVALHQRSNARNGIPSAFGCLPAHLLQLQLLLVDLTEQAGALPPQELGAGRRFVQRELRRSDRLCFGQPTTSHVAWVGHSSRGAKRVQLASLGHAAAGRFVPEGRGWRPREHTRGMSCPWHIGCKPQSLTLSLAHFSEPSDRTLTPERPAIREVVLRGRRDLLERHHLLRELSYLRSQLLTDVVREDSRLRLPSVRVSLHDWTNPAADVRSFDRLIESMRRAGEFSVVLWCTDWLAGSHAAVELLNRYQRLLPLSSEVIGPTPLEAALREHPQVFPAHDLLARAQGDAGLDTWRWVVRTAPGASLELQLAALFHGLAPGTLESTLERLELDRQVVLRTIELSLFCDELGRDAEFKQLRTARALSFLSLESWSFLQRYGAGATRSRAARLISWLDRRALCNAALIRQPRVVSDVLNAALARGGGVSGLIATSR